ncbi:MAG: epimerase [Ectothiorhodospiraceae bacterium]|nr:epimerase [Ectothiorhodospiraceae bacterium]
MKNVLITGGAGFIGSHLNERLLAKGYTTILFDNLDAYYPKEIKLRNIAEARDNERCHFIQADLRNKAAIEAAFAEYKPDLVVHLAAQPGVRRSVQDPAPNIDVNITGTINLMEVMRAAGTKKMVFASSSSIYGNSEDVPFRETMKVDLPQSPYAATKKACELLGYTYHLHYDMDIWCLRFFTVYGPRQRPGMAISNFLTALQEDREIHIYGDGSMQRDFTFIDDIIDGVERAVERVNGYEVVNIGGSKTHSVSELCDMIDRVTGRKLQRTHKPVPPGDVRITYADTSKAKELMDFESKVSLEEGIRRQWEWLQQTMK